MIATSFFIVAILLFKFPKRIKSAMVQSSYMEIKIGFSKDKIGYLHKKELFRRYLCCLLGKMSNVKLKNTQDCSGKVTILSILVRTWTLRIKDRSLILN